MRMIEAWGVRQKVRGRPDEILWFEDRDQSDWYVFTHKRCSKLGRRKLMPENEIITKDFFPDEVEK